MGGDHRRRLAALRPPTSSTRSRPSSPPAAAWSSSPRPSRRSTATTSTSCSPASGSRSRTRTVQDYEHHRDGPVLGARRPRRRRLRRRARPPTSSPASQPACFYRAGTLALANGAPRPRPHLTDRLARRGARSLAVTEHGAGRVVVLADSDLFGDDCIGELDHAPLWLNLVYWAAAARLRRRRRRVDVRRRRRPRLGRAQASAVDELRLTQAARRLGRHSPRTTRPPRRARRRRSPPRPQALAPHFPHQADYIDAARAPTCAPGSTPASPSPTSLARSRPSGPSATARDGIEHLVVFPMYKQNASRDTCFEALIVRVPWPELLAELEATGYDNAEVRPGHVRRLHRGLRLRVRGALPRDLLHRRAPAEPTSARIFCDREAERFRRVAGRAAEILRLNLPPDAAACSPRRELSATPTSSGTSSTTAPTCAATCPFDPFMIRQRSPYWMYSLEELRCDLTAFGEAVELEREGFAFARHVQYAILFDRLFRFPVTGTAGAQLRRPRRPAPVRLPAQRGLPALDRQPPDDRLGPRRRRRRRLRERVQELYHSGIDRSKLAPVDRRARPRRRVRPARRELASGPADRPRPPRGRGAEAARRPRPRRRVPAQPLLRAAAAEDAGRARAPVRRRRPGASAALTAA